MDRWSPGPRVEASLPPDRPEEAALGQLHCLPTANTTPRILLYGLSILHSSPLHGEASSCRLRESISFHDLFLEEFIASPQTKQGN
jgi:hypothetical protein